MTPTIDTGIRMDAQSADDLLTVEEAGNILRLSPQTLARRRCEGAPPTYVKIGRRCLYLRSDVVAMIVAQRRRSTSDQGPHSDRSAPGEAAAR